MISLHISIKNTLLHTRELNLRFIHGLSNIYGQIRGHSVPRLQRLRD